MYFYSFQEIYTTTPFSGSVDRRCSSVKPFEYKKNDEDVDDVLYFVFRCCCCRKSIMELKTYDEDDI